MPEHPPFHLAFAVHDLSATESFYTSVLGCRIGRRDDTWIDFDFFGHQIVAHLSISPVAGSTPNTQVDDKSVPVPHFGVILEWSKWEDLAQKLSESNVMFEIEPYVRFAGQKGEQATMFFRDPCGNAIEIKAFRDSDEIFND